jgi:hypothetical protein
MLFRSKKKKKYRKPPTLKLSNILTPIITKILPGF